MTRNNLRDLEVDVPLGVFTAITGVPGSGKTTLLDALAATDEADRVVRVNQQPIGHTPRSNLATYTGLFDIVRKLFAATDEAGRRGYDAGRFSFNVQGGRCETCKGEGYVSVELLFLPSTYAPCPDCHGARYNPATLEIAYHGRTIAEVLDLTVDDAYAFLPAARRSLRTLRDVGLGYVRLGQPATELSGGEAQRVKLAAELQRTGKGRTLYLLDEPTAGLHPADTEVLMRQLGALADGGATVVVVEHDLDVILAADHVIDLGPGGGEEGGRIVAHSTRDEVAAAPGSRTAPYLRAHLWNPPPGCRRRISAPSLTKKVVGGRLEPHRKEHRQGDRHAKDRGLLLHLPRRRRRVARPVALPLLQRRDGRRDRRADGRVRRHAHGPRQL
ncbi:hypothetical protein GCM10010404_02440 [Nonomuraea africana]|uniref:UvrABC system protein A n=1 Tax=Nonomuraea africana TaxID=46171 RepID=A0ABR9KBK7_9ACTN|nr:excinuclease UvrABC ATPase subunit [Nonomuraea africana]